MRSIPVTLLAAVLGLGACSSPTSSTLDDTVAAQSEAQEALRQQLTELQSSVQDVLASDQAGDLQSLSTTLADVQESLAGLDQLGADLDERLSAAELDVSEATGSTADLDTEVTALAEQVARLVTSIDALRASIDDVGDDLGSLETQFQRHRDDDSRHGGRR